MELYRFLIVSLCSLIKGARKKRSRGSLLRGVRLVLYRENGNCRGGSLSASSRPRLNCDVVVWFYGLFFINSIVRYQPECRLGVAELEIRLESLRCPTNLTVYRLRERTPCVRLPVLAKSPDALETRNYPSRCEWSDFFSPLLGRKFRWILMIDVYEWMDIFVLTFNWYYWYHWAQLISICSRIFEWSEFYY